jgi:hypothetical protein
MTDIMDHYSLAQYDTFCFSNFALVDLADVSEIV